MWTALGYILLACLLLRLAVSVFNLLSKPYLPRQNLVQDGPSVSVLIPARNEADRIGNLLEDLAGSHFTPCEILVYDDQSEDDTAERVAVFAQRHTAVRLIRGDALPSGWLGKNHACHCLAAQARGEVLLFLDADVRVGKDLIAASVTYLLRQRLVLLSLFPTQRMPTLGTRLVVPLMNWILLSLLPLEAVRRCPHPALAAANGQFMLVRADAYRRILPHERLRSDPVEDIATIRLFKTLGQRTAVLLGGKEISCSMYTGFGQAMAGFSKNVFRFFGGSRTLAFLYAAATTATPIYLFFTGMYGAAWTSIIAILLLRICVSVASDQSATSNLLLAPLQQVVFWMLLFRALCRKRLTWKGRSIV